MMFALSTAFNPKQTKRPFCMTSANSAKPDQTPQNAASDQVLYSLLIAISFKIGIKMKNTTTQPFERKWTGPNDKSGKFYSA